VKQADEIMRPEAVLATNTSSISITALAAATLRAAVHRQAFLQPVC
jgi:3-hydroxyacyl-CoA dehydrogenase